MCCTCLTRLTILLSSADVIVCLDANFTQKRRKGQCESRDPPRTHPDTVFVSELDVKDMEKRVASIRASGPSTRQKDGEDGDGYENGMKVPTSVLDGCSDSFLAADEKREKASTQFFADTGLMAMLCRHDRVLFVANMTSAGEKQHYALALIEALFKHLPEEVRWEHKQKVRG